MGTKETSPKDILSMSDEELLNLTEPPEQTEESKDPPAQEEEQTEVEAEVENNSPGSEDNEPENEVDKETTEEDTATSKVEVNGGKVLETEKQEQKKPDLKTDNAQDNPSDQKEPKKDNNPTGSESKGTEASPDFQGFYQQVMAPFKANGKTIQAKSPEEVIQLMQMGANYTRKMQELQPHRKVMLMLQTNGLLDEGKLSYLIDLDKKNPEAIKKLIKESGIDPLEIDVSQEPAYREGNHRISDKEVELHTTLDDIESTQAGKETLRVVNAWDQASKELIAQSPEVIRIIDEQRQSGLYDRIADEVERLRTMGQIGQGVPFIKAYEAVGAQMASQGRLADLLPPPVSKPAQTPLATRAATPKPAVTNSSKASAASSTRSTNTKAKDIPNYLSMSDEEIMKLPSTF